MFTLSSSCINDSAKLSLCHLLTTLVFRTHNDFTSQAAGRKNLIANDLSLSLSPQTHHMLFSRQLGSVTQRHHSCHVATTKEPWFVFHYAMRSLSFSLLLLLSHRGLTSWTWSLMHPLLTPSQSHCSLATSYWIICTDMASFHHS